MCRSAFLQTIEFFFKGATITKEEDHFGRLVKSARTRNSSRKRLTYTEYAKIGRRLAKETDRAQKNANIRTMYKLDHNIFLVCKGFTFGLFEVAEREKHVFTSNAPIAVYHMPNTTPLDEKRPPTLHRRTFCAQDYAYFDEYLMRPNVTYVFPEGTRYLIVTLKKCYFVADRLAVNVPVRDAHLFSAHRDMADPYAIPPATPRGPSLMRPEERRKRKAADRSVSKKPPKRVREEDISAPSTSFWRPPATPPSSGDGDSNTSDTESDTTPRKESFAPRKESHTTLRKEAFTPRKESHTPRESHTFLKRDIFFTRKEESHTRNESHITPRKEFHTRKESHPRKDTGKEFHITPRRQFHTRKHHTTPRKESHITPRKDISRKESHTPRKASSGEETLTPRKDTPRTFTPDTPEAPRNETFTPETPGNETFTPEIPGNETFTPEIPETFTPAKESGTCAPVTETEPEALPNLVPDAIPHHQVPESYATPDHATPHQVPAPHDQVPEAFATFNQVPEAFATFNLVPEAFATFNLVPEAFATFNLVPETFVTPQGQETFVTPQGQETFVTPQGQETSATPQGQETSATPHHQDSEIGEFQSFFEQLHALNPVSTAAIPGESSWAPSTGENALYSPILSPSTPIPNTHVTQDMHLAESPSASTPVAPDCHIIYVSPLTTKGIDPPKGLPVPEGQFSKDHRRAIVQAHVTAWIHRTRLWQDDLLGLKPPLKNALTDTHSPGPLQVEGPYESDPLDLCVRRCVGASEPMDLRVSQDAAAGRQPCTQK